jgi:hypothetical protein
MKRIDLNKDLSLYVDEFEDGTWINLSGDNYHIATPLTKEQTLELISTLEKILELA